MMQMHENFTHEVGDDPISRRRVRISGPVYGDDSVPLLRIEYEGGDTELLPSTAIRQFRPLESGPSRPPARATRRGLLPRARRR
jgi:hypothetical protein